MSNPELANGKETIGNRFIDHVASRAANAPEVASLDRISEGIWNLDISIPLLSITINRVLYEVDAELDENNKPTEDRSYHIVFEAKNGLDFHYSFRPSISENQYYFTIQDESREIREKDIVLLLDELIYYESTGLMRQVQ